MTRCGYDLVDKAEVANLKQFTKPAAEKVVFDIAGGEVDANLSVSMYIPDIQEMVEPYVLESPPNVLSVGRRCQGMGWGFYWRPWSAHPTFVDTNGRMIPLNTEGYIPYLNTTNTAIASAPLKDVGGTDSAALLLMSRL